MTNPPSPSVHSRAGASPPASIHSLFNAQQPAPADEADELALLRRQLAALRAGQATPEQRARPLERIDARAMSAARKLVAELGGSALTIPIQKNTRQRIRSLQQLLRALSDEFQATLESGADRQWSARALWRSLNALAQHLLISSLAAAPAVVGVWRQLHQTYARADQLELSGYAPDATQASAKVVYYSAVLLGCAQPASFTSPEIAFIAAYLARHAEQIDDDDAATHSRAAFWIDATRDTTAFACARKTAPPQTPVRHFCCTRLAARLAQQISALENGSNATQTGLPDFADTPAGRSVLRRLAGYWGDPSKRRYPRRRQNYRAVLCGGLARLWRLFQDGEQPSDDASSWMITNESPDGYAFMHVSGKTGGLAVGDLTAIRTETGKGWQICIVRWALSENQEHLEIGLQMLATRAQPARLALPSDDDNPPLLPALILPALGALRSNEMLVIPATALGALPTKLVLVLEKNNIEVREVKCLRVDEQNSKIAILSIEDDETPG